MLCLLVENKPILQGRVCVQKKAGGAPCLGGDALGENSNDSKLAYYRNSVYEMLG